jgi:predicted DCC family thiol-disulfide oxidoreductase YuxK
MNTSDDRTSAAVLLYDGDCGFCNRCVQTVLRHDRRATLRFASLASPYGQSLVARRTELRGVDSLVWVDLDASGAPRRTLVRSAAALRVASYLGGVWSLAAVFTVVPRPLRDAAYAWIARHRRQLGGGAVCLVVSAEQRRRFLDAV